MTTKLIKKLQFGLVELKRSFSSSIVVFLFRFEYEFRSFLS
jgi:hypothetical protein